MIQSFGHLFEPYQFWLACSGILMLVELLGTSGYMLWSSLSALIIGLLTRFISISWYLSWILFSVLAITIMLLWWYWLKQKNRTNKKANLLTQPFSELIGKHYDLIEPIHNGFGRVKIGDSTWRVESKDDLPIGTCVEVIAIKSNTLEVRAI